MKKNGFTLIELLAVIVILAIIALFATPIILGIINDAREKANERSVELYASAVRNGIAAYQLTNANAPAKFSDLDVQYDGKVECTVEELYSDGSFYLDGCTVNDSEKEYSYGTKQGSEVVKVCSIEQQDKSKYSVGDIVTCNIVETPDKFYVIEDAELTATSIQMLTEKNIHTIEYKQNDDAGTVAFSDSNYWFDGIDYLPQYTNGYIYDDNSLVKSIVDEYVGYLSTKLTEVTGNLLTNNQIQNLKCDIGSCQNALEWVYSTSYWTGSDGDFGYLWTVSSNGYFHYEFGYYTNNDSFGVRPVITISTSDIQ